METTVTSDCNHLIFECQKDILLAVLNAVNILKVVSSLLFISSIEADRDSIHSDRFFRISMISESVSMATFKNV